MLRATDNKYIDLYTDDVKRLLLATVVEMGDYSIEGMMSVYDDFRVIERLDRGDVVVWITNGLSTDLYEGRVIDNYTREQIRRRHDNSEIKIFRIERITADFDIVELEFNK